MKFAVIDIGTNTSRLAVFEVPPGDGFSLVFEKNYITRLGEGVNVSGRLSGAAVERTLEALREFSECCGDLGVSRTAAVGTAVLRRAENGASFLDRARSLGIDVEVITGEEEGLLVFRGACSGLKTAHEKILTIDIGGGSTELVRGGMNRPEACVSHEIGSVAATERFLHDDPPSARSIEELKIHSTEIFRKTAGEWAWGGDHLCIGVAGTISTLAMIDLELPEYDPARVHGHRLGLDNVRRLADALLGMKAERRREIPGIQPKRADIIHAGSAILLALMEAFGIGAILVSECDIRYGLLQREISRAGR